MGSLLFLIAIIAIFLYYRRNKVIHPSCLSELRQYLRLWICPFLQILLSAIFLLLSYMIVLVLSKSAFMDQLIEDHLGVFSSITSYIFNEYRTDKLSPFIEQSNEIHKYAIYLFYASIAFFIFQLYILKNKCFSKDFVLFSSIAFSIAILLLAYYYNYYSELSMSALVRTETLGLFGGSKEKAVGSAIDAVSYIGTFFFFLHYYQNIWLFQYYYEPDEVVSNNHEYSSNNYEYSNEVVKLDAQADDNKYQNLRDLKTLLDSGVLTQGEFDQQKKEILNS